MSPFEKRFGAGGPPAFRSASATAGGDSGTDGFRPLYTETTGHDEARERADNSAVIEAARREAHARGVREGRDEAGRMARAALAPGLKTFTEEARRVAVDNRSGESRVSGGALDLALAAARKVLGEGLSVAPDGMDGAREALEEALARANGVRLTMHPEDHAQLQALVHEEGLAWPDHPRIALDGDPSLARGRLRIAQPVDRDRIIEEPLAAKMAELLALPLKPV